ncbi:hypothetical protein ACH4OQ_38345, partial [Streptomyces luteogriseus]|uniref:hypothetical protein n=1 Tax=Streptomyces luteogriseus TaxID=68233 RepID=UPI003794E8F0
DERASDFVVPSVCASVVDNLAAIDIAVVDQFSDDGFRYVHPSGRGAFGDGYRESEALIGHGLVLGGQVEDRKCGLLGEA